MGCCVALHNPEHSQNQFIDHLNRSTVQLVTEFVPNDYGTYCSGFWISEYHLVTARHCVTNDQGKVKINSVVIYTTYKEFNNKFPPDNPKKVYAAVIVGSKKNSDIAILKSIDDVDHHILNISKLPVPIGSEVHTVGHPTGMQYSYIKGIVAQVREFDAPQASRIHKTLQITALINNGSSGCAVVNNDGNVVGIASFLWRPAPGMSFFIHKDELIDLLDELNINYY